MTTYFIAWQSPGNRGWYPIGRLTRENGKFRFVYTKGAQRARLKAGFRPLESFPDLEAAYVSEALFPLLSNRLPNRSRPDFSDYLRWLDLPKETDDPLVILSRSGGKRTTDSFEVFPLPERDDAGEFHIRFFAHGLRHFPPESHKRINALRPGDQLLVAWDWQNPYDRTAMLLRTNDVFDGDRHLLGFCPRYLADDVLTVFFKSWAASSRRQLEVKVVRVNPPPAPLQVRLLCELSAEWPKDFRPFSSSDYQSLGGSD